jgi:MFS family permease
LIDFALYQRLLSQPGRARIVAWSMVARLATGMNGLALTLAAQHVTGRYDAAGFVTASFLIACASAAPFLGRWIDQKGPQRLVPLMTCGYVAAMLALFFIPATTPFWVFGVLAACAGICVPPVSTLARAMWQKSDLSDADKRAGMSIEGVLTEMAFMFGPLLVSMALALNQPRLGTVFCALFCAAGIVGFLRAGGTNQWGRVERKVERHFLGPLQTKGFAPLMCACISLCMAFGMNEMVLIAFAKSLGSPALVGWLYFALCLTSTLGTLWFGGLKLRWSLPACMSFFAIYTGLTFAAMAWLQSFWPMFFLALASGTFAGAKIAAIFSLSSTLVPTRYATESGTWLGSMLLVGIGSGFALGGIILERSDWQTLALISALPMFAVAVFAQAIPKKK